MKRSRRLLGVGILCVGLGACVVRSAPPPGAADDLLTQAERKPTVMAFDISARVAGESHFAMNLRPLLTPDESRCYLRVRTAKKTRPLFIAGKGRRGALEFTFVPEPVTGRAGYNIACKGDLLAEFSDYQGTAGTYGDDRAGVEWLRKPEKWRVTVRRLYEVKARDAGDELRRFLDRRYVPAQAKINEPTPFAFLQAKLEVEVRTPTGTAVLQDQRADISVSVLEAERFGRRHPYWSLSVSTVLSIEGRQVGLKEDAGTVEVTAVLGAVQWVPIAVRLEEIPDAAATDVEAVVGE